MFERFTDGARGAVVGAQRHAVAFHHGWIGTEHLLLGLLDPPAATVGRVLARLEVDPGRLAALVQVEAAARR